MINSLKKAIIDTVCVTVVVEAINAFDANKANRNKRRLGTVAFAIADVTARQLSKIC